MPVSRPVRTRSVTRPSARVSVVMLAAVMVLAACNGDDVSAPAEPIPAEPIPVEPVPVEPVPVEPVPSEPVPADSQRPEDSTAPTADDVVWHDLDLGNDCVCADGGEVTFYERRASPERVVLYFQGGGACFSADTCAFEGGTYTVDPGGAPRATGIFDFDNPDNPISDRSVVYVPYCTGDLHLGTTTTAYSDDLTIRHNGFVNASKALEHLVEQYPGATEVLVTGISAGSLPTPLFAGLVSDALPQARVVAFGDSSGAYGDNPGVNATIASLWGTRGAVPDWPVNETLAAEDLSPPGLWIQAGRHAPQISFGRFDFAYDDVQVFFAGITGGDTDDLLSAIDANEVKIEAEGPEISSYTAPGTAHTVLLGDGVYDLEVDGVRFIDWLTDFVDGTPVDDVRCTVCR